MEPTGQVMGMLNAAEVTAFRTALTIMTLFVRVTHIRKENIVCFGSGRQVEWHVRLALLLAPTEIRNITIFNRGRSRLDQLEKDAISSLRTRYPQVNFRLVSREATPDFDTLVQLSLSLADMVFCCTPSTEPLFPLRDLASTSKPRFISAIGSYKPHMHEVDTETLLSCGQIFVDSKDACLLESGELITANVKPDQLAEIGQFLASDDSPGIPSTGNIIFKCVGMGIMDFVISRGLLDIADKAAIGQTMATF
jgi:ornithine cyclodeaminase